MHGHGHLLALTNTTLKIIKACVLNDRNYKRQADECRRAVAAYETDYIAEGQQENKDYKVDAGCFNFDIQAPIHHCRPRRHRDRDLASNLGRHVLLQPIENHSSADTAMTDLKTLADTYGLIHE